MKILVMGLPGAGKTTLAVALARELQCVHFNADEIRKEINKDLGFSVADRIEQARRMGVLCDIASRHGAHVIADFVCPTPEAREAFGPAYIVWVDRIKEGRFEDTNKLFIEPEHYDFRINGALGGMQYYAEEIAQLIQPKPRRLYAVG
jgi:nucleoside-triphosphatase THEP1